MRVALYEPEPRVCGPMASMYHLQRGFRALGHDCDVVTFTRSGKPRVTWQGGAEGMRLHTRFWRRAPDVTGSMATAGEILRSYDAVVLSDVRTISQDKAALAGKSALSAAVPDYLAILDQSGVKFTTALHGNNYPMSEVMFAPDLVSLRNFTKAAITYSPTSPNASRTFWPDVNWILSPLPYAMETEPDDDSAPDSQVVGITGRYIPNKGHQALACAAGTGRLHADVELWGACSVGAGPSQTFHTWEALTQRLQLTGKRHGNQPDTSNGGDIIKPYLWDINGPNGTIRYMGPYQDPVTTCRRLAVHMDLTASNFSDGMEFSQFEAIDAGCLQASVASMWNPGFAGRVIEALSVVPGEKKLLESERGGQILDMIAEAAADLLALSQGERHRHAKVNRKFLDYTHNPSTVAALFLEALA